MVEVDRTRFAAQILAVDGDTEEDRGKAVQRRVREMSPPQRKHLTAHLDSLFAWRAAYEAQECICFGKPS